MNEQYDFSGWATRNNILCSDGRTIRKDAFKHNDGKVVPLVWNHDHNDPFNVLGHATLENREEGVYVYGVFNDTEQGKNAKQLVQHGDIEALSIWANKLKQQGGDVLHGDIKEVSLVLSGANIGAYIDSVIKHGEESDDEAIIYSGEELTLSHADDKKEDSKVATEEKKEEKKEEQSPSTTEEKKDSENKESDKKEETIQDVIDSLDEKQKTVVYGLLGKALGEKDSKEEKPETKTKEEEKEMKHNVFDNEDNKQENVLSHSEMETIIKDAKRFGSLKESFLQHADTYGIDDIDYLFPDARTVTNQPEFIKREMGWVDKVMNGTHHTPFSRIKSIFADITEDEARAKGYIKGKLKKEEVFGLLKRTTTPTTIYKKQKLDRDDVIDIVDFDVVAWLKTEMRMMLNEEIARAILVGDGRGSSDDDKINETNIRPVWKDEDLYTIKSRLNITSSSTADDKAKAFIRAAIKSRKDYKGSGTPTLFTTEDVLTDCLLLEDKNGRVIYDTVDKLATALRVKEIVTVPVMENLRRQGTGSESSKQFDLYGIIVNLVDYNVGADKGGAVSMFDDFDIDYNQQKYLIETRCSGALVKPYSAIVLEADTNPS